MYILVHVIHHLVHHSNGHQITTIVSHQLLVNNDLITHNQLELVTIIFKFHYLFLAAFSLI